MVIKFNKPENGNGISLKIFTRWFNFGIGIGKAFVKPVFYYKYVGYDSINKHSVTLRHINIIRFKMYALGVTFCIPL